MSARAGATFPITAGARFGRCPVCGRKVRLMLSGTLRRHVAPVRSGRVCRGSRGEPVADALLPRSIADSLKAEQ